MNTICLPGRFDGKGVVLDDPCHLPANTRVVVTVPLGDSEAAKGTFRDDWYAMGRHALAAAYGDDEPEYTDADLIP